MQIQFQHLLITAEPDTPALNPRAGKISDCWSVTLRRDTDPDTAVCIPYWPGSTGPLNTRRGVLMALLRLCSYAQDAALSPDEFRAEAAWYCLGQYRDSSYDYCKAVRSALSPALAGPGGLPGLIADLRAALPHVQD